MVGPGELLELYETVVRVDPNELVCGGHLEVDMNILDMINNQVAFTTCLRTQLLYGKMPKQTLLEQNSNN
jgi:hypothetical protein